MAGYRRMPYLIMTKWPIIVVLKNEGNCFLKQGAFNNDKVFF